MHRAADEIIPLPMLPNTHAGHPTDHDDQGEGEGAHHTAPLSDKQDSHSLKGVIIMRTGGGGGT
jgi:hypothetical protein